ncbi:enoyl-CoA hydratase/isomerase family protein [Nocardia implantans]|uniref:Enoyl-CoA hydratase/isomerase family protein n=1 Tax=Nocardia implantans TaxID=3108168 RepID=A0ABU6B3G9_9NOCA|nr:MULTISPECIES: enoyl-CoA hydratase/isomerase family protein [unclassified Nocardia]MBF6195983.1 enoyl-CoA hydratase/isomerase family protein [Nocardia beijingensis]MEA3532282.1 enoyl-CoA hydratase/isomerase family protein [Nocardia sp. CDC192]MEB3514323.1 enoyl-CoA hydratase/isomerase family protein [Nocardia sp. CDC186]
MSTVLVSRSGPIATLTLNRPERLNAVSEELYEALIGHLVVADSDPQVRCVILHGAGRAFCAGADLKAHRSGTRTPAEQAHYLDLAQRACEQIQRMDTPVVAAVAGYALGAGAELAVSADFLVMADDAQIGFPEVSIGTFVGGGVTHRLPRLIGLRRAADLLILGERCDAARAFDWGLAYASVSGDILLDTARGLAESLAAKAPLPLARMKAALRRDDPLDVALATEPRQILELMATRDWAEGVAAFAERRTPVFEGK